MIPIQIIIFNRKIDILRLNVEEYNLKLKFLIREEKRKNNRVIIIKFPGNRWKAEDSLAFSPFPFKFHNWNSLGFRVVSYNVLSYSIVSKEPVIVKFRYPLCT